MTDDRLQIPQFTAHNIELPDGKQTLPDRGLISEGGVCQGTLRTLRSLFRPEQIPHTSVVDLGCLEGGYTVAFARAGFQATGIEVRDLNVASCRYVERELNLDNLRFIQDDARNISRHGSFDAVFCCGLLYHLDQPRDFLKTLSQCARQVLILQTHVAGDDVPEAHARLLSPLTTHEGNLGRWYREFPDESSPKEVEEARWSSWGNRRSFWIEKHHLRQNLLDVGFDCVYEQYDHIADQVNDKYEEGQSRFLFVAVKLD
jgi:SAM-dependent methyltransferase